MLEKRKNKSAESFNIYIRIRERTSLLTHKEAKGCSRAEHVLAKHRNGTLGATAESTMTSEKLFKVAV